MQFDVITLFPQMFTGPLSESIIKRACEKDIIKINYHDLRDSATDKHKTVDDTPCGGGKGMVLKIDVMDAALAAVQTKSKKQNVERKKQRTILLTPKGQTFTQDKAIELAEKYDDLILICGHYEGFDERIRDNLVDEEISIGDFVLTGGELPAMIIIDAVSRMVHGVLSEGSATEETFMQKDESGKYLNEYPQYTRPIEYKGWKVPDILQSGDHKKIAEWRREKRTGDN